LVKLRDILLDPVSGEQAMQWVDKRFVAECRRYRRADTGFDCLRHREAGGIEARDLPIGLEADQIRDVPRFASKLAVESAMREFGQHCIPNFEFSMSVGAI